MHGTAPPLHFIVMKKIHEFLRHEQYELCIQLEHNRVPCQGCHFALHGGHTDVQFPLSNFLGTSIIVAWTSLYIRLHSCGEYAKDMLKHIGIYSVLDLLKSKNQKF